MDAVGSTKLSGSLTFNRQSADGSTRRTMTVAAEPEKDVLLVDAVAQALTIDQGDTALEASVPLATKRLSETLMVRVVVAPPSVRVGRRCEETGHSGTRVWDSDVGSLVRCIERDEPLYVELDRVTDIQQALTLRSEVAERCRSMPIGARSTTPVLAHGGINEIKSNTQTPPVMDGWHLLRAGSDFVIWLDDEVPERPSIGQAGIPMAVYRQVNGTIDADQKVTCARSFRTTTRFGRPLDAAAPAALSRHVGYAFDDRGASVLALSGAELESSKRDVGVGASLKAFDYFEVGAKGIVLYGPLALLGVSLLTSRVLRRLHRHGTSAIESVALSVKSDVVRARRLSPFDGRPMIWIEAMVVEALKFSAIASPVLVMFAAPAVLAYPDWNAQHFSATFLLMDVPIYLVRTLGLVVEGYPPTITYLAGAWLLLVMLSAAVATHQFFVLGKMTARRV
jgi:hypothetical protein